MTSPSPAPPSPDELACRWVAVRDVVQRRIGGRLFILMPSSVIHELENEAAVHLWDALVEAEDVGASVEDLAGGLSLVFEVDPADARNDVLRFLHDLEERELVQPLDASARGGSN